MNIIIWPDKSPIEVKDYGIDWAKRLNSGEAIAYSEWDNPEGITVQSIGLYGDFVTVIWLTGGSLKTAYKFVNRIHTSHGRLFEATASLSVRAV